MKTAIVTGGGQGIGRGIAMRLRAEGWRVAVVDLDAEALDEMQTRDPDLLCLPADVGNEGQMAQALLAVRGWLRGSGLDLLVVNAGLADPVSGPIEDLSLADWARWQDSHVTGAFLSVRGTVAMLRKAGGCIITIASTRARQSEPQTEAYSAAKGALVSFTRALAVSLGPQVRANCILPGWIETGPWQKAGQRRAAHHSAQDRDQHPAGRVGRPEDIAGLVTWLASDEAGFITGQDFVVDGGMGARMIYAE